MRLKKRVRIVFVIALIFISIVVIFLIIKVIIRSQQIGEALWKYFICQEQDLQERYGKGTWAVITGASSGQGKQFALNFAERGFNLFLIGSMRTREVIEEVNKTYPLIKIKFLEKDFGKSFENDFFVPIIDIFKSLGTQLSILINNVGHRSAWIPYHEMPENLIRDTISCGTIVQARLIHAVIPIFLQRNKKSAIINITAQCVHPTFGFGNAMSNEISLPYVSVYEAANAFGFYHATSIFKEYGDIIDILNITPGAVVTENTQYLKDTPFKIDCPQFVKNVIKMLGNFNGTTAGHWKHALSLYLINLAPWKKEPILKKTGKEIAEHYMNNSKTYKMSH